MLDGADEKDYPSQRSSRNIIVCGVAFFAIFFAYFPATNLQPAGQFQESRMMNRTIFMIIYQVLNDELHAPHLGSVAVGLLYLCFGCVRLVVMSCHLKEDLSISDINKN